MSSRDLRSLTLGELLDRTFSCYKEHFIVFVGIMAIPQVFVTLMSFVSQGIEQSAIRVGTNPVPATGHFFALLAGAGMFVVVMLFAYMFAYAAAMGGTTFGISEIYLGGKATIRDAYRKMRGRIWALVKVLLLITSLTSMPFFMAGLGAAVIALRLGRSPAILFSILIVFLLPAVPFAVWIFLRYSLAIPALLLESVSARQAISRSAFLTKGYLGQIFLIGLLMTLITSVVATVFEGPFLIAIAILAAKGSRLALWLGYPMAIAAGVSRAVSSPLLSIALVLAYYNARVRKEGFDLQVMISSLEPAPGALPSSEAPAASV
jgi:hypothetical protein